MANKFLRIALCLQIDELEQAVAKTAILGIGEKARHERLMKELKSMKTDLLEALLDIRDKKVPEIEKRLKLIQKFLIKKKKVNPLLPAQPGSIWGK